MKPLRIACVGEAMIELSLTKTPGPAHAGIAGDALNTAIYMQRAIGAPHQVSFVSVIGTDALSDQIFSFVAGEGISTGGLRRDPHRLPGIYAVSTDSMGERSFLYWRENSAARLLLQNGGQTCFDALKGFDVIFLSAITLAILPEFVRRALFKWIRQFRVEGGKFAFDSNYRPRLWSNRAEARDNVEKAWQLCDIALPSLDDEVELFDEPTEAAVLKRFATYNGLTGVLKRGVRGPYPINTPIEHSLVFAPASHVVDTTAAGDSFGGTLLAKHLTGSNWAEAMTSAHQCSSTVVGYQGAIIPNE